ncbi:MAG: KH domain-containing protein [Lentisphaerae bacterium]|nr:KH domain-containing protein [Lentisphaerota bacterium]
MENEENMMVAEQPAAEETEVQMDVAAETEDTVIEKKTRQYLEVTQEMLDESAKRLRMMLDYLCLDATVRSEKRNSRIHLIVASSDAGRIIGRKGQSLESLQLLLNRMMQKDDVNYPKINIDIDGYPAKDGAEGKPRRAPKGDREDRPQRKERKERHERRGNRSFDGDSEKEETLRRRALDTAKEVRRWGESVTLPPMNSHDRRIIHITLENEPDLATESQGEGAMKSVVVSLKKQD